MSIISTIKIIGSDTMFIIIIDIDTTIKIDAVVYFSLLLHL
jgi:hypothetical protein